VGQEEALGNLVEELACGNGRGNGGEKGVRQRGGHSTTKRGKNITGIRLAWDNGLKAREDG